MFESNEFLDSLDPVTKKMVDLNLTTFEKEAIVKELGFKKSLDLNGYQNVTANFTDGDSGTYIDSNGLARPFRISDVNRIDTFDTLQSNQNSPYKAKRQPPQIAQMFGKDVSDLTENDYLQADNYHRYEVNNFLRTGKIDPFNPNIDYGSLATQPVGLAFKKVGTDRYGRDLVEAINPQTQSTVSFDLSNSPALNSEFSIFNSIDSQRNRNRLASHENEQRSVRDWEAYKRKYRENRFGEFIDLVQSNAYQSFGRVVNILPDGMKDILNIDKEKWAKIASPEGQAIADKWAGVDPTTREDYQIGMQKALSNVTDALNGKDRIKNFGKAILNLATQFDRLMADSAVQTGLAAVGSLAGGAGLAAMGASGLARTLGGSIVGGMLAGGDETLSNMQEYKAKYGHDMPADEAIRMYFESIPIAAAEGILAVSGLNRLGDVIRKPSKFKASGLSGFAKESAKALGTSTAFEAAQEYAQNVHGMSYTDPDKSLSELLSDPENVLSALAGGVMGAGMSGINTGITGLASSGRLKAESIAKKASQDRNRQSAEVTPTGESIDLDADTEARGHLTNIVNSPLDTDEQLADAIRKIDEVRGNDSLSEQTVGIANKLRMNFVDMLADGSTGEELSEKLRKFGLLRDESRQDSLGSSEFDDINELFEEYVAQNHPDSEIFIDSNNGEMLNDESRAEAIRKISEMGKKLGLDDDSIHRSIDTVTQQITVGSYGYKNYARNFARNYKQSQDESLSPEKREQATARTQSYLDKMINLADNQLTKIDQFNNAIAELESGNTNQAIIRWKSTYGKPFKLDSEFFFRNGSNPDSGPNAMFARLANDAKGIRDTIGNALKNKDVSNLDISGLDPIRKRYQMLSTSINNFETSARNISLKRIPNKLSLDAKSASQGIESDKVKKILNYAVNDKTYPVVKRQYAYEFYDLSDSDFNRILQGVQSEDIQNKQSNAGKWQEFLNDVKKARDEKAWTPKQRQTAQQAASQANTESSNKNTVSSENKLSTSRELPFTYGKQKYRSIAHAYQTLKSGKFDKETYDKFNSLDSVENADIRGESVNRKTNRALMKNLIRTSMLQNEDLKNDLLATGKSKLVDESGKGFWKNALPKILAELRNEFSKKPVDKKPAKHEAKPLSTEGINEADWSVNTFRDAIKEFKHKGEKFNENSAYTSASITHPVRAKIEAINDHALRNASKIVLNAVADNQIKWAKRANAFSNFYNKTEERKINPDLAMKAMMANAMMDVMEDDRFKSGDFNKNLKALTRLVNSTLDNFTDKEMSGKYLDDIMSRYHALRKAYELRTEQSNAAPSEQASEAPIKPKKKKANKKSKNKKNAPPEAPTEDFSTEQEQEFNPATEQAPEESVDDIGQESAPEDFNEQESAPEDFNESPPEDFNESTPGDNTSVNEDFNEPDVSNSDISNEIPDESYGLPEANQEPIHDFESEINLSVEASNDTIFNDFNNLENENFNEAYNDYLNDNFADDINGFFDDLSGNKKPDKSELSDKMPEDVTTGIDDSDGFLSRQDRMIEETRKSLNNINYNMAETEDDATELSNNSPNYKALFGKSNIVFQNGKTISEVLKNIASAFSSSASKRNASLIARNGIDLKDSVTKKIIDDYRHITDKITPDSKKTIGIYEPGKKDGKIEHGYATFVLSNDSEVAYQSPADFIIYDMTQNGNSVSFDVKDIMVLATRLVTEDYLASSNLMSLSRPESRSHLASMWGISDDQLGEKFSAYNYVTRVFGSPDSGIANRLGNTYMKFLGLTEAKNAPVNMYNRANEGLGQFAINAMVAEGLIEKNKVTREMVADIVNNDKNLDEKEREAIINIIGENGISMVRPVVRKGKPVRIDSHLNEYLGPKNNEGKRQGGFVEHYQLNVGNITTPVIADVSPFKTPSKVSRKSGFAEIPDEGRNTIAKLQNQPHNIHWRMMKFFFGKQLGTGAKVNMLPFVFKKLGFKSSQEIAFMEKNQAEAAKSKNRAIYKEIQMAILCCQEMGKPENANKNLYSAWSMGGNFRFNQVSNTINWQMGKQLSRFGFPSADSVKNYVIDSDTYKKNRPLEAFAIAQSFDMIQDNQGKELKILDWLESLSLEELLRMRHDYMTMDSKKYTQKYLEMSGFKFKDETLGLAINAFDHLIQKRKAIDSGKKEFQSYLSAELDAVTSGYNIRAQQFPDSSMDVIAEKTGIMEVGNSLSGLPIDRIKAGKKTTDVYETFALKATDKIKDLNNIKKLDPKKRADEIEALFYNVNLDGEELYKTFEALEPSLPEANNDGTVSSDLRALIKKPAIPAGYNASSKSTARVTTDEIMDMSIESYMRIAKPTMMLKDRSKIKTSEDMFNLFLSENPDMSESEIKSYRSVFETFERFNEKGIDSLAWDLNSKGIDKVYVKIKNNKGKIVTRNLQYVLKQAINPTYSNAVSTAIEEMFSNIRIYNNIINTVFNNVSNNFNESAKKKIQELFDEKGYLATREDYRNAIMQLEDQMPRVAAFFGGFINMIKTKKAVGGENPYNLTKFLDVTNDSQQISSTFARGQVFTLPMQAPAVTGIHSIDGTFVQHIVNVFNGILPIHDAFVVAYDMINSVAKEFNAFNLLMNKDYNFFQETADLFEKEYNRLTPEQRKQGLLNHLGKPMESRWDVDIPINMVQDFENDIKSIIDKNGFVSPIDINELEAKYKSYSNASMKPVEVMVRETWESYRPYLHELVAKNNNDRDAFFAKKHNVSSLGGPEGSQFFANEKSSANSHEFERRVKENKKLFASSRGFRTNGQQFQMLTDSLANPEARIQMLTTLNDFSTDNGLQTDSQEHMDRLSELMRSFDAEPLRNVSVMFGKGAVENVGEYNTNNKRIRLAAYDPKAKKISRHARASMTLSSAMAHETVHAVTAEIIANPNLFGASREVRELTELYDLWLENSDWTDFMPDNYDPRLKSVYEGYAKEAHKYIKDNKNENNIAEFAAYATTFEPLVNKLNDKILHVKGEKLSMGQRIFGVVKAILKLLAGKGIHQLADAISEARGGIKLTPTNVNIYESVSRLVTNLSRINNKANDKISQHPLKLAENMYDAMATKVRGINTGIANWLDAFINKHTGEYKWHVNPTDTKLDVIAKIFPIAIKSAQDANARNAFKLWCENVGMLLQTGTIMTFLRDISPTDTRTGILHHLSANTRLVEKYAMGIESSVAKELNEAFDNNISEIDREALTRGVMQTNMQALIANGYKLDDVLKLTKSNEHLVGEIEKVKQKLSGNYYDSELVNHCKLLAMYMIEKKGSVVTNINARMIADQFDIESDDKIKDIDSLVSLYALYRLDPDMKEVIGSMSKKGLSHFINAHRTYVEGLYQGFAQRSTITEKKDSIEAKPFGINKIVNGFTKQLFNDGTRYKVDLASNDRQNAMDGFVIAKTIPTPQGFPEMAIYTKSFANFSNRDGTAFMLRGANMMVESLSTSAYRMASNNSPHTARFNENKRQYNNSLNSMRKQKLEKISKREMSFDELLEITDGFLPVFEESKHGGWHISDYQFIPDMDIRDGVINDNYDGIEILSKMYSSHITNVTSGNINRIIHDFIVMDMENMGPDYRDKETGVKYVRLDDKNISKFMDRADVIIPDTLRKMLKREDLYVREDWLLNLFGNEALSGSNISVVKKYMPQIVKTAIRCAEYTAKMTTSLVKSNILFKVPSVLIGNIVSNIMYSIMTGSNPIKVFRYTINNFVATKDYMVDNKELNSLIMKQRLGTASQSEIRRIPVLQKKMEANPVAPLIKYGMLQSVLDDSDSTDTGNIKRLQKTISNSVVGKMTPDIIKKGVSMMYLGNGTMLYKFMNNMTQISDFAARNTEYQLRMEKAPAQKIKVKDPDGKIIIRDNPEFVKYHDGLIRELWDAFVNYDTPQSSLMQYLNDIGITMFTKYAFRIQKIIRQQIWKNPIGAVAFLFANCAVWDVDNIMDQNVLQKYWSSLVRNPIENIEDAIVPMPIQYLTGQQSL